MSDEPFKTNEENFDSSSKFFYVNNKRMFLIDVITF